MKVSHHSQFGDRIPCQCSVSVERVLGMTARKQNPRIDLAKQVVGPCIADVAVESNMMGNRHADLQRVCLRLMAWQDAMNVIARRRVRDILAGGDGAGGSVDV